MLADSGSFRTPDQKLANALLFVVKHSKQFNLQGKINRLLQENRHSTTPVMLTGRQILKVILTHYESEKGRGVAEALSDFMTLTLVNGREQEFLDRWDQIIRDLGPEAPNESVQQLRFHENCL